MKIGLWELAIIKKWYVDKGSEREYKWWLYGCFHFRRWRDKNAEARYFKKSKL